MFYHTESKPQGWRALAVFEDGSEFLIFLGRSTRQVRDGSKSQSMASATQKARPAAMMVAASPSSPT